MNVWTDDQPSVPCPWLLARVLLSSSVDWGCLCVDESSFESHFDENLLALVCERRLALSPQFFSNC